MTSLMMSSYGTSLLNAIYHQRKSPHMMPDCKPLGCGDKLSRHIPALFLTCKWQSQRTEKEGMAIWSLHTT